MEAWYYFSMFICRKTILVLSGFVSVRRSAFLGTIAFREGVALKAIPLKKITESLLVSKVKELLGRKDLYDNGLKMMNKLRAEEGVKNAIKIIEKI